jgi:hypothetical protein
MEASQKGAKVKTPSSELLIDSNGGSTVTPSLSSLVEDGSSQVIEETSSKRKR